jgi:hypothetical protein
MEQYLENCCEEMLEIFGRSLTTRTEPFWTRVLITDFTHALGFKTTLSEVLGANFP